MPGFPVHHQLTQLTQTHVHQVGDAIQPSHPLSSPSPPAFNLSQHQGLFQWVSSSHQVAKVLEFQLQHWSFQWIFRTDFLEDWLVWSPCSPRDSQESSPTPQLNSINSSALSLLYGPILTSIQDYWKNHSFECSNHCTIALISHASKVILQILQVRLQQHVNQELPEVQASLRKGRGIRDHVGRNVVISLIFKHILI